VGTPAEVAGQLKALEARGLNQVVFNFPIARGYRMLEDFATNVMALM